MYNMLNNGFIQQRFNGNMNNKFIKGLAQSALALSLASLSLTSLAGAPGPFAPTDINFDLPITFEAGHDLIEVDGPGDFGTYAGAGAADTDDASSLVNVSTVFGAGFNFYGQNYSATTGFHIGSNGYVSFAAGVNAYNFPVDSWIGTPLFMMHEGDWDPTGAGYGSSAGGNSTGTNDVFYHLDNVNDIVTVTFDDIDCFPTLCAGSANQQTASQLRFHSIGSGNFVVEYRYENVGWGLGQSIGWTAGDLANFDRNYNTTNFATSSNISHPGVYAWMFVDGQQVSQGNVLEKSANGTIVGSLATVDADVGDTFTYVLLDDANGRFDLSIIDGITYVVVLDGGDRLDFDNNQTHDITVEVTDSFTNTYQETLTINVIEAPAFLTTSNIVVPVDEAMNLTIQTHVDQGTGIPTINATGLPAWMNFVDNGDGTVTLSGFPSFELTFRVTLTLTDTFGNVTTRTFNITVEEPKTKDGSGSGSSTTTTTTTTVTVTEEGGSGGSFGWLTLILLGGLLTRRKFN